MNPRPETPAQLLALTLSVAREAGKFLLDGWRKPRTDVSTKSSATDLVSEMDRGAEKLIIESIIANRPDDGFLGEEGSSRRGTSGVRWIIDPLDGTTNYLYGLPAWGVSIAAAQNGKLVVGVVLAPALDLEFAARDGGGSFRNGVPIGVSKCTELATALIATGFGYDPERRRTQAALLTRVLPLVRDIRRVGSAALDLCWAACGNVDAYYEAGCNPWDLAAGTLIVREAGGVVTDLAGAEPSKTMCVAAPPDLHAPLIALLQG